MDTVMITIDGPKGRMVLTINNGLTLLISEGREPTQAELDRWAKALRAHTRGKKEAKK